MNPEDEFPRRVYSPILKTTRIEWDENAYPDIRNSAETEAARDLQKPLEQLLADVHEEAIHNEDPASRIAGANKRMVSLMAQVVRSNNRQANLLMVLTVIATVGTILQVFLGVLQLCQSVP